MWNADTHKISRMKDHMWIFTYDHSHVKIQMWIFTCEFSHMKFHMWKFTSEISHVKNHMWNFTCEISHVKFHMWNFTCEKQSHGKFHMWNFTCEISHVKSSHMGNFPCEFSHVTLHMWNTCETHIDRTCDSHVKLVPCETHGIWNSHVFLELHMCESHVSHMRNFCKGWNMTEHEILRDTLRNIPENGRIYPRYMGEYIPGIWQHIPEIIWLFHSSYSIISNFLAQCKENKKRIGCFF